MSRWVSVVARLAVVSLLAGGLVVGLIVWLDPPLWGCVLVGFVAGQAVAEAVAPWVLAPIDG